MMGKLHWSERSFLLAVFLFAFALRLGLMLYLRSYLFPSDDNYFPYGYETGRIAAAIVRGHGFSSPFRYPSGPTSWLAPVYPSIVAMVFKIFGIYSKSSAVVILLLQSLFSALTCVVAYYISKRLFNSVKSAALTAILLTVYPASIWFSINYIWDDSLLALCLAASFLFFIYLPQAPGLRHAFAAGLLMGFTLLVSPVLLSFYLSAIGYICWRAKAARKQALIFGTVACLMTFLVLLPWLLRNFNTFGQFGLVKSGFGVELRAGNNPQATGTLIQAHGKRWHPALVQEEFERYARLGEVNYSRECYDEAINFIRANPARFSQLCLKRIYYFWLGDLGETEGWLGNFSRSVPSALLIKKISYALPVPFLLVGLFIAWRQGQNITLAILLFLTFPLVYYITHVLAKYRYYIDALILVFACYGFYALGSFLYGRHTQVGALKSKQRDAQGVDLVE